MTSLRFLLFKLDSGKIFIKNHKPFFFTETPGIETKRTPTGQMRMPPKVNEDAVKGLAGRND